jgi:thioredoxin reductase
MRPGGLPTHHSKAKSNGASMSTRSIADLPVAVIGAGPVGLAAAAHLLARGVPVKLYEAGDTVAAHVRDWGHVRVFSPWRFNIDAAAASILRAHGWQAPPADALPTGNELYSAYLAPLAATPPMRVIIETGARVHNVARDGIDKVVSKDRADHPFAITIHKASGETRIDLARAVIDASGTWTRHNPASTSGTPAAGEVTFADRIAYGVPDVLGRDRPVYQHQRVLVIGGGHSAANVLLDLAQLAENDLRTHIIWAVRAANLSRVFGGGSADRLPARGKLGDDLRHLVDHGRLELVMRFGAERIEQHDDGLVVVERAAEHARVIGPVDRIVVCTGHKALAHPEPGYFAIGVKSYGRAPTFLMATGYEQARSVVAHLAGDEAAASDVRLVLPETGVCTADYASPNIAGAGCCGGPAPAGVDACCVKDAAAKEAGEAGCGCGSKQSTTVEAATVSSPA